MATPRPERMSREAAAAFRAAEAVRAEAVAFRAHEAERVEVATSLARDGLRAMAAAAAAEARISVQLESMAAFTHLSSEERHAALMSDNTRQRLSWAQWALERRKSYLLAEGALYTALQPAFLSAEVKGEGEAEDVVEGEEEEASPE